MGDDPLSQTCDVRSTLKTPKVVQEDDLTLEDNPQTIGDELRSLWREYRASASIHGIGITNGVRLYAYRRIIWACLVIAMAVTLGVTLYNQLSLLQGHPIKTKVVVDYVDRQVFPSITICNLNQFYRDRIPDKPAVKSVIYYLSEVSGFNLSIDKPSPVIPPHLDVSGDELLNIQKHAAHRLEEMFLRCEWRNVQFPCKELFTPKLTYIGLCYSFNGNTSLKLRDALSTGPYEGLRVLMDIQQNQYYYANSVRAGIQVVIENPGEATFPMREGLSFRPGISAFVALTKEERKGLPYPYHAYGNSTCLDSTSSSFKNPLRRFKYKLTACILDCFYEFMIKQCNCTFFNDPAVTMGLGYRICNASELLYCYGPKSQADLDAVEICGCKWPCDVVSFQPTITYADISSQFVETIASEQNVSSHDYLRNNMIDLSVYFKSMGIFKVIQEPEISVNEIVGTLGGQMGLFLGASILSVTEILEIAMLFISRTCGLLWKRLKNKCACAKKIGGSSAVKSNANASAKTTFDHKYNGWIGHALQLKVDGEENCREGY